MRDRRWRFHLPRLLRPHTRGQALVELALILPVLMLLATATVDLGRLFYAQITIAGAAREGALEAGQNPTSFQAGQPCDPTTNRVMCRVLIESQGSFYTITPADVTDTCMDASGNVITCPATPTLGETATIKVVGHFGVITPIIAAFTNGASVTLSSTAVAQLDVQPTGSSATPSPSPSPTPTPTPSASPTATPSPTPTPTPVICPTPIAQFSVNPTSGTYTHGGTTGTTFAFTDQSTIQQQVGCSIAWSWSFGDGAGASTQNASHVYTAHGTSQGKYYTVTLVVSASNSNGQTWAGTPATQTIQVN
jgi:Flp pilus assembly protein TadG